MGLFCEPLATVIEEKLSIVIREDKRERLLNILSVASKSMTNETRERDWERQPKLPTCAAVLLLASLTIWESPHMLPMLYKASQLCWKTFF